MEDTKTIMLRKPVELGGLSYDKLELREPTAGELETASRQDTGIGTAISMIQQQCKMPRKAVEKLCARDLTEASDFLGSFGAPEKAAPKGDLDELGLSDE